MIASARVLLVVAGGTVSEVQIELLGFRFRIRRILDLNDDGKIVAFRKRDFGNEHVAPFRQLHHGRIGTIPTDDGNGLLTNGLNFPFFRQRCDLDFAVVSDEKFQVWLDGVKNAAAIWTGFDVAVIVPIVIMFVFAFFVSMFVRGVIVTISFVVLVLSVIVTVVIMMFFFGTGSSEEQVGGRDERCRDEMVGFLFHNLDTLDWVVVRIKEFLTRMDTNERE